jgi:hypothetical protein
VLFSLVFTGLPIYSPLGALINIAGGRHKRGDKDLGTTREQVGMKNNHRGAHINDVPSYAHSFSLFSLIFLCFVRLFFALAYLYSLLFFTRVLQKQDIT